MLFLGIVFRFSLKSRGGKQLRQWTKFFKLWSHQNERFKSPMGVYAAIASVQEAISKIGIAKDRKNQQQGFMFRGVDDVLDVLSPILAKCRLNVLPRMTERTVTEKTTKTGGVLFYVTVRAEFDFVSADDGSKHTVVTYGEAMDTGDKATNKAMSAAYKYAAILAFCIPVEVEDTDAVTHEAVDYSGQAKAIELCENRQQLAEL